MLMAVILAVILKVVVVEIWTTLIIHLDINKKADFKVDLNPIKVDRAMVKTSRKVKEPNIQVLVLKLQDVLNAINPAQFLLVI